MSGVVLSIQKYRGKKQAIGSTNSTCVQALEDAIEKWQEYYSEKVSKKQELIRVLTE